MAWDNFDTPNPGSGQAVDRGCLCPVIDNGHGRQPTPWGWWITVGCPLHDPQKPP